MDSFASLNTFAAVVAFVVPGLVARWAWRSIVVGSAVDQKTEILSSIIASFWLYAFLSPVVYLTWEARLWNTHPGWFALALFGAILVWPLAAGVVVATATAGGWWNRFTNRIGIRRPEPRAWDTFFARRQECFIRVKFQDGGVIGGVFHEKSVVSCFPASEDLFLEALYRLDPQTAQFLDPLPETMGAWIDMKTVKYLEFFKLNRRQPTDDKDV